MRKPVTVCNICGKVFENGNQVRAHKSVHSKKKFICPKCGELIIGAKKYKIHLGNHTNIKNNNQKCTCEICGKEFNSLNAKNGHQAIHKKKERKLICTHCNNEYFNKNEYISHVINVINNNDDYIIYFKNHDDFINKYYVKCPICGIDKFDLSQHLISEHELNINDFQKQYSNQLLKIDKQFTTLNFELNKKPLEDTTNINLLYARGIMNHKEEIINSLTPDNVIFSDTIYYLSKTIDNKKIVKNPDFIIVNPEYVDLINDDIRNFNKILLEHYKYIIGIIEHFGDYWHSEKVTGKPNNEHELEVINFYKLFNKKCLIIWEHELNNIENVKQKINQFLDSLN